MVRPIACVLLVMILWPSAHVAPTMAGPAPGTNPSTKPVTAGRDTPEGAMNVYLKALRDGDLATAIDSWNMEEPFRTAAAREYVAEAQFAKALEVKFGHDAMVQVCEECSIKPPQTRVSKASDWRMNPNNPDLANSDALPRDKNFTPPMERGEDGIWRIG